MYLKCLDLQGFKSFPEKVKLEFNQGVTAVVGPNGSGKSNVSDAVRWVLGEQRAKSLRGDKMEDVIFAGTESRKALGFAEVSITVDNQDGKLPLDYTEVQITRRVFRSGESEYRMNGTSCRLKDVQELFMDTGVGREGYSMIGQGRIDEILSAKGDERRRIFEEAAGIVKFKSRRNEALNKLEREQQNLLRLEDIVGELEGQIAPLERQSEKAKQYLILKEELKQAEVVAFAKEMENLEERLLTLTKEQDSAKAQMAEHLHHSEKHRAFAQEHKMQGEELERLQQEQNASMVELRALKEKKEGEIRLTEEQHQNDQENLKRIQGEISATCQRIIEGQKQLELSQSRMVALRLEMERKQEELSRLEAVFHDLDHSLHQDETRAEDFKSEIFEQIRIGTEAKGEIAKREALQEQFQNRMARILDEKSQLEGRLHQFDIHMQVLEKQEIDLREHIRFLEQALDALEQDLLHAQGEKDGVQQQLSAQEKRLSEIESRLKLLQEMERENEGFFHSVKNLLQLPDTKERGICGAVGQLLQVEETYETAIEAALGGAVQNVVTETEENARDAIVYLKANNLGRATFLPISAIRGRTFDGQPLILQEIGVMGIAHELISFDEKYRQIAMYLLGRTIIVETLAQGVFLAKKYKHKYKIVTLEGDILNPGGAMTGGSKQKKTTQIFGRGREIASLTEALKQTDILRKTLEDRFLLAQEDMEETEVQVMEKKLELQKQTIHLGGGDGEREKTLNDRKEMNDRLSLILLEETQLLEQIDRAERDMQKQKEILAATEKSMEEANEKLAQFQDDLWGEKEKKNALLEEITQGKMMLSASGQSVYAVEETISRLKGEISGYDRQKKEGEDKLSFFQENGDHRLDVQGNLAEAVSVLDEKILCLQGEMEQSTAEKIRMTQAMEQAEQAALTQRESAGKMENEIFRLETKSEKLEEEKIRVTTQLWEEYEMTYRMAREYADIQPEAMEKRSVKEWRGKIRALGEVNVGSIEQYKEVHTRYHFLTKQRDDILDAEGKLRGIITELSVLMEEQFRAQFQLISENFSRVFQEMFGGGRAYLKLMDSEHVLESPIEIVAQPPGKNLQNMQLLSGGERALTAIAILFSILHMKPSPFCILDEIEAALDDANVTRFAQYLKRFSKETQFIVITHRKGTMEHADVLYGVTMQEKGISKLISVDFAAQVEAI